MVFAMMSMIVLVTMTNAEFVMVMEYQRETVIVKVTNLM